MELDKIRTAIVSVDLSAEPGLILKDLPLETKLTEIRKDLLNACVSNNYSLEEEDLSNFLAALSYICFNNEYIFYVEEEEERLLKTLKSKIEKDPTLVETNVLVLLSCYESLLNNVIPIDVLEDKLKDKPDIYQKHISNPKCENQFIPEIKSYLKTSEGITHKVQNHYEDNPYPRWFDIEAIDSKTFKEYLLSCMPYLDFSACQIIDPEKVLIAGCGTGLQAIRNALYFPKAIITAIDLSLSSLAYGKRMAEELGIENINFYQTDLMDMEQIEGKFDLIESIGVLQHVSNPQDGINNLARLLTDNGHMRFSLYSQLGRSDVRAAIAYAKEQGYLNTLQDVRRCRQALANLGEEHPAFAVTGRDDFYCLSEFRDLIFHVNEHESKIPYIMQALKASALDFVGFEISDFSYLHNFRLDYPDDKALVDLSLWDEFENKHPDTFAQQYIVWARKQ